MSQPSPGPAEPPPAAAGGTFNISIGSNAGTAVFGHGNTVNVSTAWPSLAALGLPPAEQQRVEAALRAVEAGRSDGPDTQALAQAASAPDEPTRSAQVKAWLLKVAPSALGFAGSLLNPVVGEIAKAAGTWVARSLGNPPPQA